MRQVRVVCFFSAGLFCVSYLDLFVSCISFVRVGKNRVGGRKHAPGVCFVFFFSAGVFCASYLDLFVNVKALDDI